MAERRGKTRQESYAVAVGRVLRSLRQETGMAQDRFALKAKIHRTFIGLIENGKRNVTAWKLDQFLRGLDVTWSEFGKRLDAELRGTTGKS